MHPREAYRQRTGTGRLASLSLRNSEIVIDRTFDDNRRTRALITDPAYFPMVLYPGKEAHSTGTFNFRGHLKSRTLLIFIIDATWVMARKMMYRSQGLQKLPRLSFTNDYRSKFLIKTQPADYCLSTIESSYYLIKELQKAGVGDSTTDCGGLMRVFDRMVQFQIECRKNRIGI